MNIDEMYAMALANRLSGQPIDVMRDGSERLHFAQADDFTQMATEMAGGTEPEGAQPMILQQFGETIADVPAGLLKGAVQGTFGLPGDIESITYGVRELINRGADEGMLDAFVRGLEQKTIMPTTENVKQWLDTNVGPLVPEGSDPRRVEAAKTAEFVGELGGAGKTIIEGTRAAARGARQIGREMATTAPTGQVQLAPTPLQAPRSELGFYSVVEETVANLPQAKGTGQQFLAQISKTAGVKPEEIKWTGLDEFLKGKKSVTKQEVQDYLNANRVDVKEVRLGFGGLETFKQEEKQRLSQLSDEALADEFGIPFGPRQQAALADPVERETLINNWVEKNAAAFYTESAYAPKFFSYTLPGGENYREILLTLPIQAKGANRYEVRPRKTPGESAVFDTEANKVIMFGRDAGMYQEADRLNRELAGTQLFRSSHFDQPNILAHLRVNDRTVDGKKTLFVEEIQSDWHQAGRKRGYATGEFDRKATSVIRQPGYWEVRDQNGDFVTNVMDHDLANASEETVLSVANQRIQQNDPTRMAASKRVPDAPFKTSWHELSLKRAIQEAAEKGYDQIAFTTGKTQAERYDLSKQVDELFYWQNRLIAAKNQKSVFDKSNVSPEQLENFVGKDVAKKLLESKPDNVGARKLFGEDLQVGGEGMKGFYDNILPKSLDKLGKKFGAKVGKTDMDGVEVWQMDITPKMRESVVSKGQPLFVAPIAAPGMMQQEETK